MKEKFKNSGAYVFHMSTEVFQKYKSTYFSKIARIYLINIGNLDWTKLS